jgi:hypothetical protein
VFAFAAVNQVAKRSLLRPRQPIAQLLGAEHGGVLWLVDQPETRQAPPVLEAHPAQQARWQLVGQEHVVLAERVDPFGPFLVPHCETYEEMAALARGLLLEHGLAKSGDRVVITAGVPFDVPGTTNLLKVERV